MEQVSAKANWKIQTARNATPVVSYVAGAPCRKNQCMPMNPLPWLNMNAKPHGIEQNAAEAGVDDAFHQHVDGFARAAEAGFEHREADLHAEHEERRDQRPDRVDRVDDVVALEDRIGGEDFKAEQVGIEKVSYSNQQDDTADFTGQHNHAVAAPFRGTQPFAKARQLSRPRRSALFSTEPSHRKEKKSSASLFR